MDHNHSFLGSYKIPCMVPSQDSSEILSLDSQLRLVTLNLKVTNTVQLLLTGRHHGPALAELKDISYSDSHLTVKLCHLGHPLMPSDMKEDT